MSAYYNEFDPFAAAWLRELIKDRQIADGEVDERSIVDVRPDDLRGFTQCHFFAGIGGWSYALRLAGWPDDAPVWTGSCPCQPFSSAARGRNGRLQDDRHLWPAWYRLIAANSPGTVFGEQVAASDDWFTGVCDDLEAVDYDIGAAILPAVAVGCDHARHRLYFVGHTDSHRESVRAVHAEASRLSRACGDTGRVALEDGVPARVAFRGFGNAIVPPLAAEFIKAYIECR